MSDYKTRLRTELKDLDEKLVKLKNFLGGTALDALQDRDIKLLQLQAEAMQEYVNILEQRVALLD